MDSKDRIVSAIFLICILVSVLELGNKLIFFLFANLVIVVGMYELYSMFEKGDKVCWKKTGIVLGCLVSVNFFLGYIYVVLLIGLLSLLTICLSRRLAKYKFFEEIYHTVFGITYVSWLGSHIILLNNHGHNLIYLVFFIVSLSDIAAFYTGRSIGKHYLAPRISPKKTIEGSAGGIVGSIAGALAAKLIFFSQLTLGSCIVLGILGSIAGQIGDLAESAIKRRLNQKDSGYIIPGHGGVLDRIDSYLAAVPIIYYYIIYFDVIA